MLKAENISFRYNKTSEYIFNNFYLQIKPGELIGLFGESGRGKSTLAKIISGFITPTDGNLLFNKKKLPEKGFSPVQLVFQHPEQTVNPRWKAKKILNEGFHVSDGIKKKLGINEDWLDRYPHELSGGELQRIAVARVLSPETKVLIADEMTSMLDANTQACIWNAVLEQKDKYNMGLLVISHDMKLLDRLGCRIVKI